MIGRLPSTRADRHQARCIPHGSAGLFLGCFPLASSLGRGRRCRPLSVSFVAGGIAGAAIKVPAVGPAIIASPVVPLPFTSLPIAPLPIVPLIVVAPVTIAVAPISVAIPLAPVTVAIPVIPIAIAIPIVAVAIVIVRAAAPAVTVAIEIAVAVVAVPIIVDAEANHRNAERTVILRADIDAALLVGGLHVLAGNPAAAAVEFHVAPVDVGKASADFDGRTSRDDRDGRITGARTRTHVDVRRRVALGSLRYGRRQHKQADRCDFNKEIFHASQSLLARFSGSAGPRFLGICH